MLLCGAWAALLVAPAFADPRSTAAAQKDGGSLAQISAFIFPELRPSATADDDYIHDGDEPVESPAAPAVRAQGKTGQHVSMKAAVAEYVAMTLFVVVGCGSAMGIAKEPGSAWVLQVSLTFGFAITALTYAMGHYSGGYVNCAVLFAFWITGHTGWWQCVVVFVAQVLGSITGALILCMMFPAEKDMTRSLASNGISEGYGALHALVGEAFMTFLLVLVALEMSLNEDTTASRTMASLAIGLAVFLAHSLLIPIDGCSINPTRSFGTALVAKVIHKAETFQDMWVFWIGPGLGALAAAGVYGLFQT